MRQPTGKFAANQTRGCLVSHGGRAAFAANQRRHPISLVDRTALVSRCSAIAHRRTRLLSCAQLHEAAAPSTRPNTREQVTDEELGDAGPLLSLTDFKGDS